MSKACSAALKAFLASNNPKLIADLYSFFFPDGLTIYLTSFSSDVMWNGHRYSSMGPRLTRGTIKWMQGIQVQEVTVSMAAPQSALASFGLTYQKSIMAGLWDGCECSIDRVYFHNPPHQRLELQWDGSYDADKAGRGAVNLFYGRVGEIDAGPLNISFKVQSMLELFNVMMPRNLYQPNCRWHFTDAGCTVNPNSVTVSGVVLAGSTTTRIYMNDPVIPAGLPGAGATLPPGWLGAGSIQFATGRLKGSVHSVQFYQPSGTNTYDKIVLRDQPIAYYPLQTDANDIGPNHYTGTVSGGVTFGQPGILAGGQSTLFNGTTGIITLTVPPLTSWLPIGGYTVELWLNPSRSDFAGTFDLGGPFAVRNYRYGSLAGVDIRPQNPFVTPVNAVSGAPNHLVVIVTTEAELDVYLNNALVGALSSSKYKYVGGTIQLGAAGSSHDSYSPLEYFPGYLEAVAFYAYPLNETQIAEHFQTGTTVAANVPVAYVDLLTPLPFAPSPGDLFLAMAGCDLSRNQCNGKFNNLINFGGTPTIPEPGIAINL